MLEPRPERVSKWAVLARLMAHIRQHKPRLALGLLCIICTNVFLLATPWVTGKYAVDGLQESITRQKLAYYAALIIGLTILQGVFRFFTRMLIIGVSRDVEYTLRNELFQHLESLSLSFYQKNKTGELMSRATNDLSNVRMLLGPGIMYTLNTGLIAAVAVVIVLWFGGRQVIQGAISVGDFVAFNMYLALLTWPMIALGWVVNLFERGRASMERLNYIFDAPADVRDEPGVRSDFQVEGSIEFRNLSFSYNGAPTLRNISLSIPKGKIVAIVGATGSGKSSLVQLIPRLYNAPPNSLFIDGVPVERILLETLRRAIGFIPQDTFLFGETIRENIAFGVESASDADVQRSAEISNIHEDVQSFPNNFETMVGERGITLSGGQKQRTAISRAVVRDPKILILDDALSSVDTYTEEQILHELKQVMQNRTSIIISHRVSTVKEADEIVVLDQ